MILEKQMTPEQLESLAAEFEAELERLKWDSDYGGVRETEKVYEAFRTVVAKLSIPADET